MTLDKDAFRIFSRRIHPNKKKGRVTIRLKVCYCCLTNQLILFKATTVIY